MGNRPALTPIRRSLPEPSSRCGGLRGGFGATTRRSPGQRSVNPLDGHRASADHVRVRPPDEAVAGCAQVVLTAFLLHERCATVVFRCAIRLADQSWPLPKEVDAVENVAGSPQPDLQLWRWQSRKVH